MAEQTTETVRTDLAENVSTEPSAMVPPSTIGESSTHVSEKNSSDTTGSSPVASSSLDPATSVGNNNAANSTNSPQSEILTTVSSVDEGVEVVKEKRTRRRRSSSKNKRDSDAAAATADAAAAAGDGAAGSSKPSTSPVPQDTISEEKDPGSDDEGSGAKDRVDDAVPREGGEEDDDDGIGELADGLGGPGRKNRRRSTSSRRKNRLSREVLASFEETERETLLRGIESWFSDETLQSDKAMRKHVFKKGAEGWVSLQSILSQEDRVAAVPHLADLTWKTVAELLRASEVLELNEDESRVRRKSMPIDNPKYRSVLVEGVPVSSDENSLRPQFDACGAVKRICFPAPGDLSDDEGCGPSTSTLAAANTPTDRRQRSGTDSLAPERTPPLDRTPPQQVATSPRTSPGLSPSVRSKLGTPPSGPSAGKGMSKGGAKGGGKEGTRSRSQSVPFGRFTRRVALVEFATREEAKAAVEKLNNSGDWRSGLTVRLVVAGGDDRKKDKSARLRSKSQAGTSPQFTSAKHNEDTQRFMRNAYTPSRFRSLSTASSDSGSEVPSQAAGSVAGMSPPVTGRFASASPQASPPAGGLHSTLGSTAFSLGAGVLYVPPRQPRGPDSSKGRGFGAGRGRPVSESPTTDRTRNISASP
eukprot:Rmarinus@m.8919